MAVGDVVNDVGIAGGSLTFQPAATVSCLITSGSCKDNWRMQLTDGVNSSNAETTTGNYQVKIFITNSHYLTVLFFGVFGADTVSYSGIQVQ